MEMMVVGCKQDRCVLICEQVWPGCVRNVEKGDIAKQIGGLDLLIRGAQSGSHLHLHPGYPASRIAKTSQRITARKSK